MNQLGTYSAQIQQTPSIILDPITGKFLLKVSFFKLRNINNDEV